jgi:hypothetical protein
LAYPALMGFSVSLLGACADKPPPAPVKTAAIEMPPPAPPPPRRTRVFRLPPHKPTPPPENGAGAPEGSVEALAMATPESAARVPTESQLIGLDQAAAKHLLGAATEQSEAPPATIWRYRNTSCELDLFFYLDLRSGKMRTLHYAFKGDDGDREDCLRSLVVARGSSPF